MTYSAHARSSLYPLPRDPQCFDHERGWHMRVTAVQLWMDSLTRVLYCHVETRLEDWDRIRSYCSISRSRNRAKKILRWNSDIFGNILTCLENDMQEDIRTPWIHVYPTSRVAAPRGRIPSRWKCPLPKNNSRLNPHVGDADNSAARADIQAAQSATL